MSRYPLPEQIFIAQPATMMADCDAVGLTLRSGTAAPDFGMDGLGVQLEILPFDEMGKPQQAILFNPRPCTMIPRQ